MLLSLDQLEKSASRAPELKNGINNLPIINEEFAAESKSASVDAGAVISPDDNLEKRKQMLDAASAEPVDFAFERAIGNNDAVYSNFVELIGDAKRKVGKIVVKNGAHISAFATGFMVSQQLLLTNWHVFNASSDVKNSEVEFFYEYDVEGNPLPAITFELDADTFFYSNKELDYCFVAVKPIDTTGKNELSTIGYIYLDPGMGKVGDENVEKLNIIHHPDGDYKQLSIRENLFIKITDTTIWYKTDTAAGSSGSPVFNDQWQAVALHHMGVALKNEKGEYIDKNANPIPLVDGKIDSTKVVWVANEGIRISVLLADILSKFQSNQILAELKVRPGSTPPGKPNTGSDAAEKISQESEKTNYTIMETPNNNISVSFPSSLVADGGTVTINFSPAKQQVPPLVVVPEKSSAVITSNEELALLQENKKLEDETDYSSCKGYQPNFLGSANNPIPIPLPADNIKKFIAKIKGSSGIILKYYNYSTIFHTVRMMPVISCVNVAGDPSTRQNKAKRKDNWLRDSRISFDVQLDDAWYKGSGFDKGHMSRREDANWGATEEDALRNANLTCMYTNACPQVPKINRPDGGSSVGLWGKLEQVVLEKGIEKEIGKTSKASVFNGPIFKDADPVYKGIQVPMDFFKIVIWPTDAGSLKATAFRLSQVNLVSNIDFEEIDIDQNTQFKQFQVSIKQLGLDTNLDFSIIEPLDTFEGAQDGATEITEESLKAHIKTHNK